MIDFLKGEEPVLQLTFLALISIVLEYMVASWALESAGWCFSTSQKYSTSTTHVLRRPQTDVYAFWFLFSNSPWLLRRRHRPMCQRRLGFLRNVFLLRKSKHSNNTRFAETTEVLVVLARLFLTSSDSLRFIFCWILRHNITRYLNSFFSSFIF